MAATATATAATATAAATATILLLENYILLIFLFIFSFFSLVILIKLLLLSSSFFPRHLPKSSVALPLLKKRIFLPSSSILAATRLLPLPPSLADTSLASYFETDRILAYLGCTWFSSLAGHFALLWLVRGPPC